jgi:hypothetical protein
VVEKPLSAHLLGDRWQPLCPRVRFSPPLGDHSSLDSLGSVQTQLQLSACLSCFWLVGSGWPNVIFSLLFFPFQKNGKKLILGSEDLDHIASNTSLKWSSLGEGSTAWLSQAPLWTPSWTCPSALTSTAALRGT